MTGPILVTGAGGFIGGHLVDLLQRRGHEVVPWTHAEVELTDAGSVRRGLRHLQPSVVYHLAAAGLRREEVDDPATVQTNISMMANLVELLPEATLLVVAGTMAEYGTEGVLVEQQPCRPNTAYAIGKFAAGALALSRGPARGLAVHVMRIFATYGPGERPFRLFPSLVRELRAGRSVALSDGAQVRDFVHVEDVAEAMVRVATAHPGKSLVTNVGTGVGVSVADACRWVCEALSADLELLRFGARPRLPGDAGALVADTSRLRQLAGWVPPQRLSAGMDLTLLE